MTEIIVWMTDILGVWLVGGLITLAYGFAVLLAAYLLALVVLGICMVMKKQKGGG